MDKDEQKGYTPLEWGFIAFGISVAIFAAVNGIGCKLDNSCKPPAVQQQSK